MQKVGLIPAYRRSSTSRHHDRVPKSCLCDVSVVPLGNSRTAAPEGKNTHPVEMQRSGWQAIWGNFKKYTEAH
jgi:hypothetical protein